MAYCWLPDLSKRIGQYQTLLLVGNCGRTAAEKLGEIRHLLNNPNVRKEVNIINHDLMGEFDRSRTQVRQKEEQFYWLCSQSLNTLTKLQERVRKNKHIHDGAGLTLSGIGTASGIVALVSLIVPVALPLVVIGIGGAVVSGVGSTVKSYKANSWKQDVQKQLEKVSKELDFSVYEIQTSHQNMDCLEKIVFDKIMSYVAIECSSNVCKVCVKAKGMKVCGSVAKWVNGACNAASKAKVAQVGKDVAEVATNAIGKHLGKGAAKGFNVALKNGGKVAAGAAETAGKVAKVAGPVLVVGSLAFDLFTLGSTLANINDPHELDTAIEKMKNDIKEEQRKAKERLDQL